MQFTLVEVLFFSIRPPGGEKEGAISTSVFLVLYHLAQYLGFRSVQMNACCEMMLEMLFRLVNLKIYVQP